MPESTLKRTIDFSNVGESRKPSAHVPEGDYLLEVESIEIKKSDNGPFENTYWQFSLVGRPSDGIVYETATLKAGAEFRIRDLLEAFGMAVPKKKAAIDFAAFLHKRVGAYLGDNTYDEKDKDGRLTGNQKTNSKVVTFFPASRLPAAGTVATPTETLNTTSPSLVNGHAKTDVAETVSTSAPAVADDEVEELTFVDEAI